MLKIYLARHGQDEDNQNGILNGRRDMPLTEIGRLQAATLAEKIKQLGLKFDVVLSSPLKRALETAKTVSAVTGAPQPIVLDDLIERDFGVMTGEPVASIRGRCAPDIIQAEIITYFLSPPGAETFPDLVARAKKLLATLGSTYPNRSILLVTHGDFGKMVYAAFYNLPWEQVLVQFHFGNSELLLLWQNSPAASAHVFKQEQHNH